MIKIYQKLILNKKIQFLLSTATTTTNNTLNVFEIELW